MKQIMKDKNGNVLEIKEYVQDFISNYKIINSAKIEYTREIHLCDNNCNIYSRYYFKDILIYEECSSKENSLIKKLSLLKEYDDNGNCIHIINTIDGTEQWYEYDYRGRMINKRIKNIHVSNILPTSILTKNKKLDEYEYFFYEYKD